jgi:hypothetical protein
MAHRTPHGPTAAGVGDAANGDGLIYVSDGVFTL